jgi:hypothetical protein
VERRQNLPGRPGNVWLHLVFRLFLLNGNATWAFSSVRLVNAKPKPTECIQHVQSMFGLCCNSSSGTPILTSIHAHINARCCFFSCNISLEVSSHLPTFYNLLATQTHIDARHHFLLSGFLIGRVELPTSHFFNLRLMPVWPIVVHIPIKINSYLFIYYLKCIRYYPAFSVQFGPNAFMKD